MEMQRIAAVIKEHGFYLMKEDQLRRLFADGDGETKRFVLLASLAREREWSFEFQPHDGDVRIASLPAIKTNGSDGVFSNR